ncbi:MAG: TetR/AcrR family transcriptional regulator [Candidatus Cloacimonadaceae bacterium]|jgi:AcrR family transcriptional regulator|nr:TetR family transcriptional regulator [Candidatus Cloacimonadota bacterium]MCB5255453.1 TetR family transcriptional regulator [Candidatus Cloacimonadota bacterium]MCK9178968.1 TetR family transcriptional regulator [Candidatus Cloacimonadota bacterium]MCK9242991.1 TetR family transcriptional regulator [Candidatus Cloacimonadota bacterium]MDY0126911.1 TetR/AcrR family transcriptional regulator [Candidatus Cloacimonadaceae bacterium]
MTIKKVKQQIITAATKEFLSWGFDGARMQAIADKAGVNKALLHYYFESKEKLYYLVLKTAFSDLIEALLEIFGSEEDFEPWLKRLIQRLLREINSRPQFSRFVIWELNARKRQLPRLFQELLQERTQGRFLERIQAKLSRAGVGDYPAEQFMLNVVSLCMYPSIARPLLEQVLGKELFSGPDFIVQREEEIFQLIKHGILKRTRGDI